MNSKEKKRAYYLRNREKLIKKAKAYYQKNRERIRTRQRAYQKRPEVKAKKAEFKNLTKQELQFHIEKKYGSKINSD